MPCGLATAAVMALLLIMARSPVLRLLVASLRRQARSYSDLGTLHCCLGARAAATAKSRCVLRSQPEFNAFNSPARPRCLFFVVLGTHANSGTRQERLITRHYEIREQKLMPAIKLLSCLLRSFIMGRYQPFCRLDFLRVLNYHLFFAARPPLGAPLCAKSLLLT